MKHWINFKHLRTAEQLNGGERKNIVVSYFIHLGIALREALTQLIMCIGSIVHGLFPFLIDFKLLEAVVNQAIRLHKFLPQHPAWEKLKKELNDE